MSARGVYVYRLVVTLPEGSSEPGWRPPDWPEICQRLGWYENGPFRWPTRRNYLDGGQAQSRAALMRILGATVRVEYGRIERWAEWGNPL